VAPILPPLTDHSDRHEPRGRKVVVLCVLVVLTFYLRAAWSYGKSLEPVPRSTSFQNEIADAFLSGHLNLPIKPPSGLLQLPDPYDPVANEPYRANGLHDLSLYKGKLYAYFGPAPAVLLYIPFRLLRVGNLSPRLAALIFGSLGFICSVLLLRLLARWCCEAVPAWIQALAVLALGLGLPTAWMIYIGRDYEVSIACASMLVFAGLYLLLRGLLAGRGTAFLALGSAALALAVGARPTMVPAGLFVAAAVAVVWRAGLSRARRNRELVALIVPYVLIAALLGLYNWARFGSVAEFGASYELAGLNSRTYPFGRLSNIPRGYYFYLLSPARLLRRYPYLFLRKGMLFPLQHTPYLKYTSEPVAGGFTNMPVTWIGYPLLLIATRGLTGSWRRLRPALVVLAVLVIPAAAVLTLVAYAIGGSTMRYELDFLPLFALGSTLAWVVWSSRTAQARWIVWAVNGLWLLAVVASVTFNLAITRTPCAGTGSC
jgi:hypothetical protein